MPKIELPDNAREQDVRAVRQAAARARRNAQIEEAYPDLRDKYGWERAMQKLAERHHCSFATVRQVLKGRR